MMKKRGRLLLFILFLFNLCFLLLGGNTVDSKDSGNPDSALEAKGNISDYRFVVLDNLVMRDFKKNRMIDYLPYDTMVKLVFNKGKVEEKNTDAGNGETIVWQKIIYKGQTGWVEKKWLRDSYKEKDPFLSLCGEWIDEEHRSELRLFYNGKFEFSYIPENIVSNSDEKKKRSGDKDDDNRTPPERKEIEGSFVFFDNHFLQFYFDGKASLSVLERDRAQIKIWFSFLKKEITFEKNSSSLLTAVWENDIVRFRKIMAENSSEIRKRFAYQNSLLHYAVADSDIRMVEEILDNSEDFKYKTNSFRQTPLHWAAAYKRPDVAKLLLERAKDPQNYINSSDSDHRTAFHYAILSDDRDMADLLMEYGISLSSRDSEGNNYLNFSFAYGSRYFIDFFLKSGIDIKKTNALGNGPLFNLLWPEGNFREKKARYAKRKLTVVMPEKKSWSLSQKEISDLARYLLKGVDTNQVVNSRKSTLLHYAVAGHVNNIIPVLAEQSSNVDRKNELRQSALHYAVIYNNLEAVDILMENGADINLPGSQIYKTPLFIAMRLNRPEMIKKLRKYGASFRSNAGDSTVLHEMIDDKIDIVMIEKAIEIDADVNALDEKRQSPIFKAVDEKYVDAIKVLLQNGADINVIDKYGQTPLIYACTRPDYKVITTLVDNGADINVVDSEGRNVFDLLKKMSSSSSGYKKKRTELNRKLFAFFREKGIPVKE